MLTIRGICNGKGFKAIEDIPKIDREIPVAIVFLEDIQDVISKDERQRQAAQRMHQARQTMEPIGVNLKELVEAGREH
ncbi:MAG: hypothetical protein HUU50_18435 [Candidatus Brocadiae bacterium]|nr:hypothetical protein [Candidatus Brocadiia bacterium]